MCTATTYKTKDFYFGRTLDNPFSYGESITITPRNYPFHFSNMGARANHYAIIGTAHIAENYPLYYDAANEKGLCMAGLNFVGNAFYGKPDEAKDNIAPFEFIPWILCQCATVSEALKQIERINLIDRPFSNKLKTAELHWLIADSNGAVTVESVKDGIHIYQNPVGVLTNNPPFCEQMQNLNNYMRLSPKPPENLFSKKIELKKYSLGMGALGLPGDLSSASRFVRTAFVKLNSVSGDNEKDSVNQFFHILGAVEQQRGCCETDDGQFEITVYTSCCNADRGIYYYTGYGRHRITGVDMHRENLNSADLIKYPMITDEDIKMQN